MRYNPALDGIRAVAIALVIIAHSFIQIFPGGWIGVDVFFVLSGYLITRILARELAQTGRIAWRNFYWRRFLRLTPALLILVVFQIAHAAVSPHNGSEIREATLLAVLYLQNWNMAFGFGPADIIGHTWSLATEEQFYLLWPVALFFLAGRRPPLCIGLAIVAMTAARFYLWKHGAGFERLQFAPDVRPVGLLIGCGLARIPNWRMPAWALGAGLGCLVALSLLVPNHVGLAMILAPLVASAATVVIIAAVQNRESMLAWPPAVYLGKISYGLYLYSAPIGVLGAAKGVNPFVLMAVSVVLAALSYEFVEKPVLRLRNWRPAKLPVVIAAG
jgi:peptidoglycan/LPS O-acetylase OafA/YrhL